MTRIAPILVLFLTLAGCAQFPELDTAESPAAARADYPQLVPLGPLLAGVDSGNRIDGTVTGSLEARAAALRARAARLRSPTVSPADRTRLRDAQARNTARLAGT